MCAETDWPFLKVPGKCTVPGRPGGFSVKPLDASQSVSQLRGWRLKRNAEMRNQRNQRGEYDSVLPASTYQLLWTCWKERDAQGQQSARHDTRDEHTVKRTANPRLNRPTDTQAHNQFDPQAHGSTPVVTSYWSRAMVQKMPRHRRCEIVKVLQRTSRSVSKILRSRSFLELRTVGSCLLGPVIRS